MTGRSRLARILLLAALGLTALALPWLAGLRPLAPEARAQQDFVVRSAADSGEGTLRAAIFASAYASGRARISIEVPLIRIESPLPPLVNPAGVVLEPGAGQLSVTLQAGASEATMLHVAAPRSLLRNLRVESAPGAGISVTAADVRLEDLVIAGCRIGVLAGDSASDLEVESCDFDANGIGIQLSANTPSTRLVRNNFRAHGEAAVWRVAPQPLVDLAAAPIVLDANRFDGDRMSVVLINVPAVVENNTFVNAREVALYLTGRRQLVRENRVRSAASLGIVAVALEGGIIESNEIDHNRAVGILLRDSGNAQLRSNNVHTNAYGVAVVFGVRGSPSVLSGNLVASQSLDGVMIVGSSPVVRGNRMLGNGGASVTVFDYRPERGAAVESRPLFGDNVFENNGQDEPVRAVYPPPKQGAS